MFLHKAILKEMKKNTAAFNCIKEDVIPIGYEYLTI
jgi:hypothetical protein